MDVTWQTITVPVDHIHPDPLLAPDGEGQVDEAVRRRVAHLLAGDEMDDTLDGQRQPLRVRTDPDRPGHYFLLGGYARWKVLQRDGRRDITVMALTHEQWQQHLRAARGRDA